MKDSCNWRLYSIHFRISPSADFCPPLTTIRDLGLIRHRLYAKDDKICHNLSTFFILRYWIQGQQKVNIWCMHEHVCDILQVIILEIYWAFKVFHILFTNDLWLPRKTIQHFLNTSQPQYCTVSMTFVNTLLRVLCSQARVSCTHKLW